MFPIFPPSFTAAVENAGGNSSSAEFSSCNRGNVSASVEVRLRTFFIVPWPGFQYLACKGKPTFESNYRQPLYKTCINPILVLNKKLHFLLCSIEI